MAFRLRSIPLAVALRRKKMTLSLAHVPAADDCL